MASAYPRRVKPLAIKPVSALTRRRTASDLVAESLRDAINSGRLEDGAVLNQVEIAELFNVSRVPVREAMRMLEAEGLIDATAHRSPVVRAQTGERVAEFYEVRALLEGHLAEHATPNVDAATVERLRAINDELRDEADHVRWLERNAELHHLLYAAAGRPETLALLDAQRLRCERYVSMWSGGAGIQRNAEAVAEHEQIIDRVAAGDAAGARDAVVAHVEHTRDAVMRLEPSRRD